MKDEANQTHPSLLLRLRESGDAKAWQQFVEIYTPLVHAFCRKRGLQDADAADVCQEVMRSISIAIERFEYDPRRGKFRNWLLTVVRNKLYDFLNKRQRLPEPTSGTSLMQLAHAQPSAAEESEWDTAYHWRIYNWAAERIRGEFQEKTWKAFWQTMVERRDSKEVAACLGLSIGAIYVAKSRVLARLRQEMQAVDHQDAAVLACAPGWGARESQ